MIDRPRLIGRNFIASPRQARGRSSHDYGNTKLGGGPVRRNPYLWGAAIALSVSQIASIIFLGN